MFVTTKENSTGGRTSTVLNSLGAYLRYLDGASRDDYWQEYVVTFSEYFNLKKSKMMIHSFSIYKCIKRKLFWHNYLQGA